MRPCNFCCHNELLHFPYMYLSLQARKVVQLGPPPRLVHHLETRAHRVRLSSREGEHLPQCKQGRPAVPLSAKHQAQHTLVPLQPSLKAASWANSSPKPSIMPLTKGRIRLMAAPRRSDQMVGGW
jgi:hypothetical protein